MDQKKNQQQDLMLLADFMLSFFLLSKAAPPGHFTAVCVREMGLKFSFDHKCRETSRFKANGFF